MKRQSIDGGGWIDLETAKCWQEGKRFDGRNHVSLATGSQWEHEALYRSKKGAYIIQSWSQWQGSSETWYRIESSTAAQWLIANEHELPPDLAEQADDAEV